MSRTRMLTEKLLGFYTPELFQLLRDIVSRRTGFSLRIIYWFVTSYSRRMQCNYMFGDERVIVYSEYKAIMRSYQNTCFDPFCRRARVYVDTSLCAMVDGPVGGDVLEVPAAPPLQRGLHRHSLASGQSAGGAVGGAVLGREAAAGVGADDDPGAAQAVDGGAGGGGGAG